LGKNKKSKKKKNGIGKILFVCIVFLLIGLGAYLGYSISINGGGLQGFLATILDQDATKLENLDTINVLLLGVSQDLDSELTDTIMVCSYNPKTQKASMLSVPRDTFVGKNKAKASGNDKINAMYARKGPEETMEYVEKLTGMEIKYYVVVNNQVVIDLVDAIDGVYFNVPIDMKYDDKTQNLHIQLSAGYQKIDGEHAEQLLRFRHNNNGTSYPTEYGDNDYGRMRTQREFMMEVAKQTLNLKNITRIKTITSAIFENVETNLTLDDIYAYLPWAVSFDTANISSNQVPGESEKCNGLWFFVHSQKQTTQVVSEMNNYLEGIEANEESISNTTNTTNTVNTTNKSNTTTNTKTPKSKK